MQKEGQLLCEELKIQDKITEEEEQMIMEDQERKYGTRFKIFEKMDNILNKILTEVNVLHKSRETGLHEKWTENEVSQLLVAVFNLGEGEWYEIQKRMDFSSSQVIKSPNQVGFKWKQIKRVMKRDIKRMKKDQKGLVIVTKHEWIISTLKTMGIGQKHLDIL